ncbi:MAG TPA: DinB family protein [Thermoanaerobaculia bacterium]|nr:DinB family protein [Thermoanaerobaculia bacterium]
MTTLKKRLLPLVLLAICTSVLAAPQQGPGNGKSAFRNEFLANLDDVQEKIMELATAVPADKYAWRPGGGVRSIGEVYMHIAGGNYFLATFLGKQAPADIPRDLEKITDKQSILGELRRSFDHIRAASMSASDADLEKGVQMFGAKTSQRGVFVTMLNHLHEHLGQSIAYARMNGVVPPWSR